MKVHARMMKILTATLFISSCLSAGLVSAQVANDVATRQAILDALPAGLAPEQATADDIALAARTVVFSRRDNLLPALTQVMVSLGELTESGVFGDQHGTGDAYPPIRFYNSMVNLASGGKLGLTPLDIIPVSQAMIAGFNFLNDAEPASPGG